MPVDKDDPEMIDDESPIERDPNDESLKFKHPIPIHYYDIVNCTFEKANESGVTMPTEEYRIEKLFLYSNEELAQLYEKVQNNDVLLPIPLDLQLMFGFLYAVGGYKPESKTHK